MPKPQDFKTSGGAFKTRTVSGEKFLYLLMLHVLPKGFRRTRCYGFLHPCSKNLIKFLQVVLRVNPFPMFAGRQKKRPVITCPICGAEMKIIRTQIMLPLMA
ncbi:MAG: transposase [Deltaproteobacteria bacterium]|nr:transposase [Deltaproteobacteria bacterium]